MGPEVNSDKKHTKYNFLSLLNTKPFGAGRYNYTRISIGRRSERLAWLSSG